MFILPKVIYKFNAITIKILMALITELGKKILKYVWNYKISQITNAILRKKKKAGDVTFPDSKLYHKAIVIISVWYWHKNIYIDQLDRMKSRETN